MAASVSLYPLISCARRWQIRSASFMTMAALNIYPERTGGRSETVKNTTGLSCFEEAQRLHIPEGSSARRSPRTLYAPYLNTYRWLMYACGVVAIGETNVLET